MNYWAHGFAKRAGAPTTTLFCSVNAPPEKAPDTDDLAAFEGAQPIARAVYQRENEESWHVTLSHIVLYSRNGVPISMIDPQELLDESRHGVLRTRLRVFDESWDRKGFGENTLDALLDACQHLLYSYNVLLVFLTAGLAEVHDGMFELRRRP